MPSHAIPYVKFYKLKITIAIHLEGNFAQTIAKSVSSFTVGTHVNPYDYIIHAVLLH